MVKFIGRISMNWKIFEPKKAFLLYGEGYLKMRGKVNSPIFYFEMLLNKRGDRKNDFANPTGGIRDVIEWKGDYSKS